MPAPILLGPPLRGALLLVAQKLYYVGSPPFLERRYVPDEVPFLRRFPNFGGIFPLPLDLGEEKFF